MSRKFSFDTSTPIAIPGWDDHDDDITDKYTVGGLIAHGDISDLYAGTAGPDNVIIKVCRNAENNDLLRNEWNTLAKARAAKGWIKAGDAKFPRPYQTFGIDISSVPRVVNVFYRAPKDKPAFKDPVTLSEVHIAYPQLDPRDAAWMFNRLIDALHCLHATGYVHGAVTPDHLLIEPEGHRGQLLDFSYAVKAGEQIKAICPQWNNFYPSEVFEHEAATPATDIYMAAKCMFYLMGSSANSPLFTGGVGRLPDGEPDIPVQLCMLLRACMLSQDKRIQTAQQIHEDFRDLLTKLYGQRTFRPFAMPVAPTPEPA